MTTVYRAEVAYEELRRHSGTQFDPRVVDALLAELGAPRHPVVT